MITIHIELDPEPSEVQSGCIFCKVSEALPQEKHPEAWMSTENWLLEQELQLCSPSKALLE